MMTLLDPGTLLDTWHLPLIWAAVSYIRNKP